MFDEILFLFLRNIQLKMDLFKQHIRFFETQVKLKDDACDWIDEIIPLSSFGAQY